MSGNSCCACALLSVGYSAGVQMRVKVNWRDGLFARLLRLAALRQVFLKSLWEQTAVKSLAIAPVRFTRKQP